MKVEFKKIGNYDAVVHFNEEDKLYTIYSPERGGAIISNENKKTAEEHFKRGMQLAEAIRKLPIYSAIGRS